VSLNPNFLQVTLNMMAELHLQNLKLKWRVQILAGSSHTEGRILIA